MMFDMISAEDWARAMSGLFALGARGGGLFIIILILRALLRDKYNTIHRN